MKIPMVPTPHDRLGNTGRKTGFWLEEFAAPLLCLPDAGVDSIALIESFYNSFALVDGRVVTGQNPASGTVAAKALMDLLAVRKAA